LVRWSSIGCAFLVVATTVAAKADDSPPPIPVKAPPAATTSWSWTGFYVGGHLGAAVESSTLADPFGPVSFGDDVRSPAFIAGGQVGANWQIGNVVLGAEADLSWADSSGDNTCFGIVGGGFFTSNCSVNPNLFGAFTGRLGYAFGRTLVYAKGGAAWEHNTVDMIVNRNPGANVLTSATSYGAWGWTAGGGVEYGLTPAWSLMLEYDFLGFGTANVATPYVTGNPLPGHPVGPIAGLSDNVQEVKLGINYRIGENPTLLPANASTPPLTSFVPLKAPSSAATGWEIEGGARYMFSWGREQWDLPTSPSLPAGILTSRLTWNDLQTNSAELFGRVDTPWNIFLSGFFGAGETFAGNLNDEDFNLPAPARAYNNTAAINNGHIGYAVVDLGYDLLRNPAYKIGPFIGYSYFNQSLFKFGCQQIANSIGNCVVPIPTSQLFGTEDTTWQGLRVGLSGEVRLADRWRLAADAAFLPYVTYTWLDDHSDEDLQFNQSGRGVGVQAQTLLSYDVTERFSVGIGARYWAMWSTSASETDIPSTGIVRPNRNAIELAGAFVQTAYRFAPNDPIGASSGILGRLPIVKAPAAVLPYNWTGLYGGIEGGGAWGQSKQIGQFASSSRTADATPWFAVDGGLLGGTVGYNAQFARRWVFGLEGDMSWVTAQGSAAQIPPFRVTQTASTDEDWLATTRARIGMTPFDRWLIYGTGGLAVADVGASVNGAFAEERFVRVGWTAGGGVEWAIAGNWAAKVEYLFVGLENHAYFVPTPNNPNESTRIGGVPLNENIVRGGVNYKTNWL
jgi:opacity protein-like surface antigen/outer membrane protease